MRSAVAGASARIPLSTQPTTAPRPTTAPPHPPTKATQGSPPGIGWAGPDQERPGEPTNPTGAGVSSGPNSVPSTDVHEQVSGAMATPPTGEPPPAEGVYPRDRTATAQPAHDDVAALPHWQRLLRRG